MTLSHPNNIVSLMVTYLGKGVPMYGWKENADCMFQHSFLAPKFKYCEVFLETKELRQ